MRAVAAQGFHVIRTAAKLLYYSLFIPLLFVVAIFLHEFGHAFAAKLLGYHEISFYVWPGYRIYPDFRRPLTSGWFRSRNSVVEVTVQPPRLSAMAERMLTEILEPTNLLHLPRRDFYVQSIFVHKDSAPWHGKFAPPTEHYMMPSIEREKLKGAIVALMGSGTTLLVSIAGTFALIWLKPAGFAMHILRLASLLHLDILTYTVFPYFFGARHLLFWGGSRAEPVIALSNLGVPAGLSVTVIVLISLILLALYASTLKNRRPQQPVT